MNLELGQYVRFWVANGESAVNLHTPIYQERAEVLYGSYAGANGDGTARVVEKTGGFVYDIPSERIVKVRT